MPISRIVFLLFISCLTVHSAEKSPLNALPANAVFNGSVAFHIDTLLQVNFGNDKGYLPCPANGLCFGPNAFDIDEDGCVYVLNLDKIYKFSTNTSLIWEKKLSNRVIDFKYYRKHLFFLVNNALISLDANTGQDVGKVDLSSLKIKNYGTRKATYFYDKYVFFRNFDPRTFEMRLQYIFDLERMQISSEIRSDSNFCLITKYEKCDIGFIKNLFNPMALTHYLSQSAAFIVYTYSCNPTINKECTKATGIKYYAMSKKNGLVKHFGDKFSNGIGKKISLLSTRPFVFISDTSAVFQTINIVNGKPKQATYQKVSFIPW